MGILRFLGIVAAILFQIVAAILIMVWFVDAKLSDGVLIALSAACSFAVLAWGLAGGKPLPKWVPLLMLFPCLMLGICILMAAADRYSLFAPWLAGALAAVAFVIIGCGVSWRSIGGLNSLRSDEGALEGQSGNLVLAAGAFAFAGVLFFQPLIILINGQGQTSPPVVVPGKVSRIFQTQGRGAADYIVMTGPAAAFRSTWTKGEFKVDARTYRKSPVGARKCLTVRTGLLQFRWWAIADCS